MEVIDIDFITVLVAAIIYFVIGLLWYSSQFFGKQWREIHKVKTPKKAKIFPKLIIEFILSIVIALFISILLAFLGATSTMDGIYAALGVWFGFILTTQLPLYLWSKGKWKGFFIDISFYFIGFASMGAIIGA